MIPEPSLAWLDPAGGELKLLARIWATVELERALADLAGGGPGGAATELGPGTDTGRRARPATDPLLGARVAVLTDEDGTQVAVAEPSTEGRLAAVLARQGEGPAGRYVRAPVGLAALRRLAAAAGVSLSAPADGPFGPSVLVVAGPIGAPIVILVDPAAVPSRP
jgi:hypothetical protein